MTLVAGGPETDAKSALGALGIYAHDEEVARAVREAVAGRESTELDAVVFEVFGRG